eukprot:GHVU01136195.1.p3 GENE.GHVU01136195.1~~GHVU01136195.1.p3  ORF type:complete len:109 (-),score=7.35 GHVU01136195.1:582-908(-)
MPAGTALPLIPWLAEMNAAFCETNEEESARCHATNVIDMLKRNLFSADWEQGFPRGGAKVGQNYLIRPHYWAEYEMYVMETKLRQRMLDLQVAQGKFLGLYYLSDFYI